MVGDWFFAVTFKTFYLCFITSNEIGKIRLSNPNVVVCVNSKAPIQQMERTGKVGNIFLESIALQVFGTTRHVAVAVVETSPIYVPLLYECTPCPKEGNTAAKTISQLHLPQLVYLMALYSLLPPLSLSLLRRGACIDQVSGVNF